MYEISLRPVFSATSSNGENRANVRVLIEDVANGSDIDDQSSVGYLRGFGGLTNESVLSQHLFSLAAETTIRIGVAESAQGTNNPVFRTASGGSVSIKRFG